MSEQKGLACGENVMLVFWRKLQDNLQSGGKGQIFATEDELREAFEEGQSPSGASFERCMLQLVTGRLLEGGPKEGTYVFGLYGRQFCHSVALKHGSKVHAKEPSREQAEKNRWAQSLPLATA